MSAETTETDSRSAGSWRGKPLESYEKDELIAIIISMEKMHQAALKVTSAATLDRMSNQ